MKQQKTNNLSPWLADFSEPIRIFTVIVVAEMMVIVYSLSFISFDFNYLNRLAVLSLLAQLIAISIILLLSVIRDYFNRFKVPVGLSMVLLLTLVLAVTYTQLLGWIDQILRFDLIDNNSLTTLKISLATGMTLLGLIRYFYVQDQWTRQVRALSKAQMNALQARIKPHFLYNSLNSIATLIAVDPTAAEKAVLNLSGLFRKAFSNPDKSMTSLSKELEWVSEYLAIEKLRLMDRLDFDIDVDESLLDQQVPLLSIQPLVENAVIHGIQHIAAGGLIELKVHKTKLGFRVEVRNPYRQDKVKPGSQTGLDNIKQRLALTYGDKVKMTVNAGTDFMAAWEVKL